MSIMDLFKTQPTTKTEDKKPAEPAAGKENLSQNPPTTDSTGKMPGTAPENQNPLDAYSKMFDTATNNSEIQAPAFKLDPKVVGEVASKMDFTRGINQEVLQKATSGDVNALLDIIKTVGQNSYRAAIEHGTALTDTHLSQRGDFESKRLERGVNKKLTESALSSLPNYNHPVVKNELNRIASQMAAANPDASPQQIAEAAQKYLSDLYGALNPQQNKEGKDSTGGEMDWTKYLSSSDN